MKHELGPLPERSEDSISRTSRILALVDTYNLQPNNWNRSVLRVSLMGEFDDARTQGTGDFDRADMLTICAALADYFNNHTVLEERRERAQRIWQMLRARC